MDQEGEKKGETVSRDAHAAPPRIPFRTARHHRVQGKIRPTVRSQNEAVRLLLVALAPGKESSASRVLEHLSNSLPSSSRALEVLLGPNLLCHSHTLRTYLGQNSTPARSLLLRTSSGVTGLWFVFLSSSITLGSRRRSFLQATRIIGSPGQKCITSEIHCTTTLAD